MLPSCKKTWYFGVFSCKNLGKFLVISAHAQSILIELWVIFLDICNIQEISFSKMYICNSIALIVSPTGSFELGGLPSTLQHEGKTVYCYLKGRHDIDILSPNEKFYEIFAHGKT